MKVAHNRNQLFKDLGTNPTNPRWSWCAISPDNERAIFTLWKDLSHGGRNQLIWTDYHTKSSHGAKDQRRILELVMRESIPAYGLICIAHNPDATPRKIKAIETDYLVKLRIERSGEIFHGRHLGQVPILDLMRQIRERQNDGLRDLAEVPPGNNTPDRAIVSGFVVRRDNKVRAFVIKQAKGKCEYCQKTGFEMANGSMYLEAHHVISLANAGKDTVDNVIAICPEHHREAHFGKRAVLLESEFIKLIIQRNRNHPG